MRYELPQLRGRLIERYKRFLADVRLDEAHGGGVVTAHCPNSGAMTTCWEPGCAALLSDHGPDTHRKLRYTLEACRMGRAWVGVNTMHPNRVVAEAIRRGQVPELAGYMEVRREVVYGKNGRSRVDILLSGHRSKPDCFVEVKNTTLRGGTDNRGALFPDAVTERGRKHLEELAREVRRGKRAVIFFFVGRADCRWMGPADAVDPEYGQALRRVAARWKVEPLAYRARVSPMGIALLERLPVCL